MTPSDPLAVAASAAGGFKVLDCEDCARNVQRALLAAGYRGQLLEIRGAGGREFMICLSYDGGMATITQNGRHVGVRVGDVVFDNLHSAGMPFDQWLKDFDAIGGVSLYSAVDF